MKIAVNTRLLIKNHLDGIGRFSLETLKRITKNNPQIEFHFIFDRQFSKDFIFSNNIIPHILYPPTRHPFLWYIWFEYRLPNLINKKIKPDLFLSPDGFLSTRIKAPSIAVIHDINFEHRPQDLAWFHSKFYRIYFKKYAQIAKHIVTVSKFSKKDIVKTYDIKENKIIVVYNGVSEQFKPISEREKKIIKKRITNNVDFFLFVGSLHKRKNIKNLFLAFEIYKQNHGGNKLVIIGKRKWWDKKTENVFNSMKYKKDVIFLGQVDEKKMPLILASAKALCFVSLFEGFGLPIVEAMKSGVPVITSNTSSMPEIAKDAAIIVDPHDVVSISKSMSEIDQDNQLRKNLINLGLKRSQIFNWDLTSAKIAKLFEF